MNQTTVVIKENRFLHKVVKQIVSKEEEEFDM